MTEVWPDSLFPRGYRDALKLIHERSARLPISEATIQKLHAISRGEIWDAGAYKCRLVNRCASFVNFKN